MSKLFENITKFFTKKVLLIIALIVIIYFVYNYSNNKYYFKDTLDTQSEIKEKNGILETSQPQLTNENGGYANVSTNNPLDLLPADNNSSWQSLNPEFNRNAAMMPDLMDPSFFAGTQSISSGKRNKNLQLRSEPPIPKVDTGPWNQSTQEYDNLRLPLEIGSGY